MDLSHPAPVLRAAALDCAPPTGGVRIAGGDTPALALEVAQLLYPLGLLPHVQTPAHTDSPGLYRLRAAAAQAWMPENDSLHLHERLDLHFSSDDAHSMRRQIAVAMLGGPVEFEFPSVAEWAAALRLREHIVRDAHLTALAFKTETAERPQDCWTYDEDRGFTVLPGHALIDALEKATQPGISGKLYSFSCYRASEYVILLALARTLAEFNPALGQALQAQWQREAIMSRQFHDVFLREYGSMEAPLPGRYYVPGDRLWFRNPDEASADATGYEGSWVFYLGDGLFSDFWRAGRTYTLESKCLEIYHWRHGTYRDAKGELQIDEVVVEDLIAATLRDPLEYARIQASMQRFREPRGEYTAAGGCLDTTREYPRWICPATGDMVLPAPLAQVRAIVNATT